MSEQDNGTVDNIQGNDGNTLETLVQMQKDHEEKMLRSSRIRTIAALVICVFVVVGVLAGYNLIKARTEGLPALVDSTSELIGSTTELVNLTKDDLSGPLEELAEIDFTKLDRALAGLESVDYEKINESIQALYDTIRPFAAFMNLVTPEG
jgi:hypothetical protein